MIRLLTCALTTGLLSLAAHAQTLTTNAQGQRVIVYPDGTTRLFDSPPEDTPAATEPDGTSASPVAPAPMAPTPTLSTQATPEKEADAALAVRRRVARLVDEKSELEKLNRKLRSREAKLANRLRKLRNSDKMSDRSQVEIVNQQLVDAREASRTSEEARGSIDARIEALRETLPMSIAQRSTHLRALGLDYLLDDGGAAGGPAEVADGSVTGDHGDDAPAVAMATSAPEALATDALPAPATDYARYDRRRDTKYAPPTPSCVREFDGLDEFTGKRRVILPEETFFTYTSPDLKPFLKDASLITCNARLMRTGKTIVLETTFVIRSQFAAKEFGVLPKGSQMTFRSIGGQQVSVKNQLQSQAEYDPVAKVSTYRGRYPLSRGAQKFLGESLLDEVRVMWGTGFDDYALYDLSFLKRQLDCI